MKLDMFDLADLICLIMIGSLHCLYMLNFEELLEAKLLMIHDNIPDAFIQ